MLKYINEGIEQGIELGSEQGIEQMLRAGKHRSRYRIFVVMN